MDNETLRTLITALSAILTTSIVAFFGWLSLDRKEKLSGYKRELISVYRQFSFLYECESLLLQKLERLNEGKAQTIKAEVRKVVVGDSDQKIVLTSESIKKRIIELQTF